ncbi:hypothetical protein H5410_007531 [Solanum commersonii]|uniref:Uncharacterized protein n=1 Tax=Solanum commersonii TaxID=4109 RepID=A0A9J6ACX9_SOLCO|nr:hypothetical protein H5410_007531 [Solanum commersonii]
MVRFSVTKNGASLAFQNSGQTTFMVSMIAASISMMAIVIFACAKSSTKRKNKNKNNPYSHRYGDGNKAYEKTPATSTLVNSTGEKLVNAAEIATTIVDITSNDHNDGGKDIRYHGGDTTKSNGDDYGSKNNDVSMPRSNDNNYVSGGGDNNINMGGGHSYASANTTTSGGSGNKMVRLSVTKNGASLATIFMVGMIAASISMMAIIIFACAKSSTKRKNKNNPYSGGGGDNKAQKTRASSMPVCSTGEILISAAEIATTFVDIPSTYDVCDNNNDGGKDN